VAGNCTFAVLKPVESFSPTACPAQHPLDQILLLGPSFARELLLISLALTLLILPLIQELRAIRGEIFKGR
jgi:hypothetical protein